jgi:PEP-CTERM motif
MSRTLTKVASAAALALIACATQATPLPGLQNQDFTLYNGSAPKNTFTNVNPVGWTGGNGLIFIDAPGTATSSNGGIGVYGPFSDPPTGGNFVEADGNPTFDSGFNYTVSGLTIGQTYTLSFYQAGGQQQGFASGLVTKEQWIVALGTQGLNVSTTGGPNDPLYGPTGSYSDNDPNADIVATQAMTTPSGGVTPWQFVSVTLTADATTDLLSFLAWGDNGSTVNLPPMVFLSGVDTPDVLNTVPEPGSVALVGLAMLGLVAASRKLKRTKAGATAA